MKNRRAFTVSAAALAGLMVIGTVLAAPASAQTPGVPGFTPIGDYLVEIEGQDSEDARIFGAREARSLLLMGSDLPAPLLINLGNGSVAGVQLMKIAQRTNGSVDLLPDPVAEIYGSYSVDGDRIVFEIEGRKFAVKPKPVLTGQSSAADLVEYDPAYGTKRDIYSSSSETISKLQAQGDDVRVRVYFGTWCPFCSEMVPRVLKIANELEGSKIQFEYYGLPRRITEDAEARALNISGVPTGIVYRAGKEVGRIQGNSWRSPEQAILDILQG